MVNSAAAAKLLRPLKKKKTIRQEKGAKDSDSFITFCSVPGGGRTVPLTVGKNTASGTVKSTVPHAVLTPSRDSSFLTVLAAARD
jgi:hypothetical protein